MQICGSLKEQRNIIFFLCLLCFTGFSNSQYITGINVTTDTTILVDGASHTLTCSVLGGPVTQISWYFEEQMISSSDPHYSTSSDSLRIIVFSSADEGAYSCVAENNHGKIVSSSLQLQLAYFIVETAKLPEFQILSMTSSFSLACPLFVFSSLPPPTVTWTHDGVLVDTVFPLVLSLDYELIFTTVKSSDGGRYSCDVTNSLLNMNEVVDVAAVTISLDSSVDEFLITPDNETVIEGDDVSFQCIITQGSTLIPVEWRFGDITLLDSERIQFSQNSFILTISGVRKGDMGSYSCAISSNLSDRQLFTLSVIGRPDIISNQSLYSELPEGSNISLSCQSVGAPPLSYSWYYNADPLPDTTLLEEIDVISLSTNDSGTYQCYVENSAGVDTNTFIVNVKTLTPQFISLQDDILAFVGSSFTFSCVATSAATLSYVFSVNNQTLPTTGYFQHNDTHYSVIEAAKSHSGVYTCEVSTPIGTISHAFIVQVVDPTTPYASLIRNKTVLNNTVELNCRAVTDRSYPTLVLSYRWEVDGVEVISDGRVQLTGDHGDLEINPVVLTDAGEYTCVAVTSDTQLTLGSYLETVIGSTGLIIATVPGKPFNVEVVIHNSTSVRISWSPPASDGGVAIQSYIVEYLSDESWLTAGERIFTFITFSVCPGQTYRFQVLAVNGVGKSEASVSTRISIPSLVPNISPVNLSVRPALFQLSLEWEIPTSPTECVVDIIDHSIHYYTLSQSPPRSVYTGSSDPSFILSGLNSSTSFNISVAFINTAGIGEYSQYISAETADLLAAPSGFEVESYGIGWIAVYFVAPPHSVITGYKLLCLSQLGGVINRMLGPEKASQLTVISGVATTLNVNYSCTVSAFNAGGDGLPSVSKIVTPSHRKVPGPPLSLSITTSGSYSATFDWTSSDGTTQFLLTLHYRYSLTPHTLRRTDYNIPHNSPYINSSLFAGVDYSVRLAGVNDDGIGFNQTSEFSLPSGRPGVPLLFVSEELDVITLSWSILHDGGSNITNVTVENLFDSIWNTLATYEDDRNSSYSLNNAEKGFEFRVVISNYFGRTESTPVLIYPVTKPVSTLYIIGIAVLITSTLLVLTSLFICGLCYFSYWRQHKKSRSISVRNNKRPLEEESKIFRNLNNTLNQRTDKFPARHSETSSDSTDNPSSYNSTNHSRNSRTSYGSKSSKSSGSSRHMVEVLEKRQGPVSRGLLAQPGKIQSAKLAQKSVVFADHRTESSGDSESSWTNTFNRQMRDSPNPINLEEYSPPLAPKPKGNSQPHPLSLTTNSCTNILPPRGSELWDPRTEDTYPVLISHKKSRSDDISDHYSTVFDITPNPPPARSNKLTSSKHKIRSKSPISFLTQKLSPIKARTPVDTPRPLAASSYDENVLSCRVFGNQDRLRMPSPNFVEHQHTDSVQSQQTSSLSSAC